MEKETLIKDPEDKTTMEGNTHTHTEIKELSHSVVEADDVKCIK